FLSMLIRGSPYRAVTMPEHKIQDSPTKPPELLSITALSETNSAQTAIGHATAAIARLLTALAC
ncbi:hypothetical protein, partial [Sulfitobacter sp. 1A15299]|uniref:hypothetical protein n=1 Tax=Sulfitobacter sp. 1A15299 TaxID=3368598 RepID=UPI0037452E03